MSRSLLVITPDYPPFRGGIQHLLQRIVEGMESFESTVVTRSEQGSAAWDATRAYPVVRLGDRATRWGAVGPVVEGMRTGMRIRPDVVLAGHLLASPAALALHARYGIPFALYLYADELPGHRRMLAATMKRAAVTIAISDHTRDLAASLGAPIDRCVLIPPGVDVPPQPHPADRVPGLIVTVARLTDRYKGHDVLLEAMPTIVAAAPGAQWVIVGEGPLRSELETRAGQLGLKDCAVRFLGRVSNDERDQWLSRASVFCMPSRLPPSGLGGEGFGIVFLEAGGFETPVVAGAVGGALDAVDDKSTGLLVDPADPSAVAGAIIELLLDPDRASEMGAAGRLKAEAHAWGKISHRVEEALLRIVPT